MQIKNLLVCIFMIGAIWQPVYAQVTERPKVEESSTNDVFIKRVELTDDYTIVYLQFINEGRSQGGNIFPDFNLGNGLNQIWLDKGSRLYKPGEVDKKFKLIRAENIQTNGKQRVRPGETVDFVAYFERLTPGIEIFDFYEGKSAKGEVAWNFFGVHIKNPTKKKSSVIQKSEPEVVLKTPNNISIGQANSANNLLQGNVYSLLTQDGIPANITYLDREDTLEVKSSSGRYRIGIDLESQYELTISSPGYLTQKVKFSPADSIKAGKELQKDFYLQPLKVGEKISLPNIYFETSQSIPKEESYDELKRLTEILKQNPSIHIRVEGHTDNVGDPDKNLKLSEERAIAIKNYLIVEGIDESRIEAKGYGSMNLISKSSKESERLINRRVEFVIIKE